MSRKVSTVLINSRTDERDSTVREGIMFEQFISAGKPMESYVQDAKKLLGLSDDAILQMDYEAIVKQQNNQTKAFLSLANARSKAEETGLLEEVELEILAKAEAKMAAIMAARFDVEVEDLYEEGEK